MPTIRPLTDADCLVALTGLLHAAYASLAQQGSNFTAVDQTLSQLAVHPDCRGRGLGGQLMDAAEAWAREQGFAQLALDTAKPAEALRSRCERRGYVTVGGVQWQGKTYGSVLMVKVLAGEGRA